VLLKLLRRPLREGLKGKTLTKAISLLPNPQNGKEIFAIHQWFPLQMQNTLKQCFNREE